MGEKVEREEDSKDPTAIIRHIRLEEAPSLSMKRSSQNMVEEDQAHSMVDQVPCVDHHMGHLVTAHPWVTLPSTHSINSTTRTCSSKPSITHSTPCSYSSTMLSTVVVDLVGILPNKDTCNTSLHPHPVMLQEHRMGTRLRSKQQSEYLYLYTRCGLTTLYLYGAILGYNLIEHLGDSNTGKKGGELS